MVLGTDPRPNDLNGLTPGLWAAQAIKRKIRCLTGAYPGYVAGEPSIGPSFPNPVQTRDALCIARPMVLLYDCICISNATSTVPDSIGAGKSDTHTTGKGWRQRFYV